MASGGDGKSFSRLKNGFLSGVSSLNRKLEVAIEGSAQSSVSVRNAKAADADILVTISELGLNDSRQTERDKNYELFNQLCIENGQASSSSASKSSHSVASSASVLLLPIEVFVKEMIKMGHSPQWADATFRAFDRQESGFMSRHEFVVAMNVLKNNRALYDNPVWLSLRRKVAFAYYSRQGTSSIDKAAFNEFLDDLSTTTEDPATMGVANKLWRRNQAALKPPVEQERDRFADYDEESLRKALIEAKMELAQKEEENELLHLEYINMEKYACKLKLQLAREAAGEA